MRIALPTLLAIAALSGQICHAECKVDDACDYAARSVPLHPATLGEAMDAQRAVDVACRNFRACIKRETAAASPGAPAFNPDLNPAVREFWKKQAEKERRP